MTTGYCKKCKKQKQVLSKKINKKDILELEMSCGHKRAYQLVTSSEDYKHGKKKEYEKVVYYPKD